MATSNKGGDWRTYMGKLEDMLELYLVKKAPSLPKQWKELIVSLAPWLTVVMLILLLPAIVAVKYPVFQDHCLKLVMQTDRATF